MTSLWSRLRLRSDSERRIGRHLVVPQTEPPNVRDVLKQRLEPRVRGPELSCTENNFRSQSLTVTKITPTVWCSIRSSPSKAVIY